MEEIEISEKSFKERLGKLAPRLFKAIVQTAVLGVFLVFIGFFVAQLFAGYPKYIMHYEVLAWATLFFTFAIKVTEETIYKFCFIVARAFFLIVYLVYATDGGIITIDAMEAQFMVEFIPILALMILVNVLAMARGILQAIEFTSASPKD